MAAIARFVAANGITGERKPGRDQEGRADRAKTPRDREGDRGQPSGMAPAAREQLEIEAMRRYRARLAAAAPESA